MVQALRKNQALARLLEHEDTQFEVVESFEYMGQTCKRMVDIKNDTLKVIADIKTASTIEFNQLQSAAFKYGYHNQASWYLIGREDYRFQIFAVESKAPHDTALFEFDDDLLFFAKSENVELVELALDVLLKQEMKMQINGQYPNNGEPIKLSFPKWADQENENFDLEELE
jgi:hypothetical protein